MGIVVAESVAGDVGADFADAGATGLAVTIGLAGAAGFLAGAIGFNAAPGLVGATGLVGAAGLEGGGMRNLLELVLDECDAEGRKGLAWVGEASPRQVLAEGEGNWLCPRPATHFDRDGRPPGTHDQLLPPPTLPLGYPLNLYGQVHDERISQANKRQYVTRPGQARPITNNQ